MAFLDFASTVLDAFGMAKQYEQDERDFEYNKGIDERNFEYTKSIDERNFAYERALQQQIFNREDTAYQRAVADAQAAGLSKGVVSGGAGSGSVLGTASSSYNGGNQSHNMDWSKLGSLTSNYQQRKLNAMSMKQMQAQVDISEYQKQLLDRQDDMLVFQQITNPFYLSQSRDGHSMQFDSGRAQAYRDAQFETLMKQEEMKKAAAEEYIKHPWLKDVLDTAGTVQKFVP